MDIEDNGMMHHAVYDGSCDHGVSEIIAKFLEVDVCGDQCGSFAVTAIYDLEKQRGVLCVLLLQPIKTYFVDEQDVGRDVLFELSVEAIVGPACHQFREHVGCRRVSAAVQLRTADEEQCFGNVAFPRARVSSYHKSLFAAYEVQFCNLHHLGFIHSGLEAEVQKKFSLGQP